MSYPADTIKAALLAWLETETSLPVIWKYQSKPRPGVPFVSVNPDANVRRAGLKDAREHVASGVYKIHCVRETLVSIHAHGNGTKQALRNAEDALQNETKYKLYFGDRKLAARVEATRDLSQLKGGQYEERGQMDLMVRSTHIETENVDVLESVELTLCADPDEADILIEGD